MSKENCQAEETDTFRKVEIAEEELKQLEEEQLKQKAMAEKDLVSSNARIFFKYWNVFDLRSHFLASGRVTMLFMDCIIIIDDYICPVLLN